MNNQDFSFRLTMLRHWQMRLLDWLQISHSDGVWDKPVTITCENNFPWSR